MAFEGLSEKLQGVFKGLKGKGSLTEKDINDYFLCCDSLNEKDNKKISKPYTLSGLLCYMGLTRKEFELLAYLIRHKGKICSREQILSSVWSDEVIVLDRTIDVNITRLRSKIGKYGLYIVTRSGFGYGFRD